MSLKTVSIITAFVISLFGTTAFAADESFCIVNNTVKDGGPFGYSLSSKITQEIYGAETGDLLLSRVIGDSLYTSGTGRRQLCLSYDYEAASKKLKIPKSMLKYVTKFVIRNQDGEQTTSCQTEKIDHRTNKTAIVYGDKSFNCSVTAQ